MAARTPKTDDTPKPSKRATKAAGDTSARATAPTKRAALEARVEARETARREAAMTADQRVAIGAAHRQNKAVRVYLTALATGADRRRRGRPAEAIRSALLDVAATMADTTDRLTLLLLTQQRQNLEAELAQAEGEVDASGPTPAQEAAFVEHAAGFSARRRISWATWRELGVSAATLSSAGINRD